VIYSYMYLDLSVWDGMFAKARPIKSDPVAMVFNVHCLYPPSEEPLLPFCVQAGYGGVTRRQRGWKLSQATTQNVCVLATILITVAFRYLVVGQNSVKSMGLHPAFVQCPDQ